MPKTEWDGALWMESDLEDRPVGVRSRAELLVIETDEIEWRDAEVCAPFEVLLLPWGESNTICSTAFVRPLGDGKLPFIALGAHKTDGPRKWRGGGPLYADENAVRRHLRRALPALLRRRLWGRVLWLDRELNLADQQSGVLRLYLGANGQGEWFLPGLTDRKSVRAGFDWDDENRVSHLLNLSDQELLERVYALAEVPDSDLAFSLNWVSWGADAAAREKRIALNFRLARDAFDDMIQVLRWAMACEPELSDARHLVWGIDPLSASNLNGKGSVERFFNGRGLGPLPSFSRDIRAWTQLWFGVELDENLRARHRCMAQLQTPLSFIIERRGVLSAHEQLEAFAQLRDFLAARVAPDELKTLLKLD